MVGHSCERKRWTCFCFFTFHFISRIRKLFYHFSAAIRVFSCETFKTTGSVWGGSWLSPVMSHRQSPITDQDIYAATYHTICWGKKRIFLRMKYGICMVGKCQIPHKTTLSSRQAIWMLHTIMAYTICIDCTRKKRLVWKRHLENHSSIDPLFCHLSLCFCSLGAWHYILQCAHCHTFPLLA